MGKSFAADATERDAWVDFVDRLRGLTLAAVRYVCLDYGREEFAPGLVGPRWIVDARETQEPTFTFPGGHTLDFGVELLGSQGETWSVTWDPPGKTEGLAIFREALLPDIVSAQLVAVHDVSCLQPWSEHIGSEIEQVNVMYEPWDTSGAWWCREIELAFASGTVRLLEAQGNRDGTITPSADNIVVPFILRCASSSDRQLGAAILTRNGPAEPFLTPCRSARSVRASVLAADLFGRSAAEGATVGQSISTTTATTKLATATISRLGMTRFTRVGTQLRCLRQSPSETSSLDAPARTHSQC